MNVQSIEGNTLPHRNCITKDETVSGLMRKGARPLACDVLPSGVPLDALRVSFENIDSIVANLPAGVLIVEDDGRILYANTLMLDLLQRSRSQLIGQEIAELVTHPWRRMLLEVARATQEPKCHGEGELETNGSAYRYRIFPVVMDGGLDEQIGLLTWDVTEHKQLQDQLIQAQKLTGIGTLVFDVAHEINSPLQGILGMGEMLLDESDPATMKEYAKDILEYTNHIASVVRELAAYARPASRDVEADVNVSARLVEAVKMVRRNTYATGIEVLYQLSILPPIRARRLEIDQILVNLISNAMQAMNGSGQLKIGTEFHGSAIRVQIADNGCGIPKHLLNKIFDAFFTTKEAGKGTGLGLSIVQKLVEKYHGMIDVASEEGRGTTVTLEFPVNLDSVMT